MVHALINKYRSEEVEMGTLQRYSTENTENTEYNVGHQSHLDILTQSVANFHSTKFRTCRKKIVEYEQFQKH